MIEHKRLVHEKQEEIEKLTKINGELQERVNTLEQSLQKQDMIQKRGEVERAKCSVIIKGIPCHPDAEDNVESKKQTQEMVKQLLNQLNSSKELGFTDSIRFKKGTHAKPDEPGLVKFTLSTPKLKGKLFEALAKAAKAKRMIPKVSVSDEIPAFLREKKLKLETQAYHIRQSDKTIKTRVFLQGMDLVLKVKSKGETKFSLYVDDGSSKPEKASTKEKPKRSARAASAAKNK